MIAYRYVFNSNAQKASMDDLALDLAVVEGDDDFSSEPEESEDTDMSE